MMKDSFVCPFSYPTGTLYDSLTGCESCDLECDSSIVHHCSEKDIVTFHRTTLELKIFHRFITLNIDCYCIFSSDSVLPSPAGNGSAITRPPIVWLFRTHSPVRPRVRDSEAKESRIEWKISFSKWKRASKKLEAEILSAAAEEWSSMYVCRRRHCRHHFCVLNMENFHSFCHIKLCDFIFLLSSLFSPFHGMLNVQMCSICRLDNVWLVWRNWEKEICILQNKKKLFASLCVEYSLLHTEACSSVDDSRNFV